MRNHVHHVHLFASDLDASLRYYRDLLGGVVVFDGELAGVRSVLMRVGTGRLHFYDQPPPHPGRGTIHHFGIQTDDLEGLVARMQEAGVVFRKPISDLGAWKYIMASAPDDVLIELFEVARDRLPPELGDFFE